MTFFEVLIEDKYLLRDILKVRVSLLKEQKELHEINCPDCEKSDKPCKKYYWLVLDIQETSHYIEQLNKLLRETYA